jgi:hypothetical protein
VGSSGTYRSYHLCFRYYRILEEEEEELHALTSLKDIDPLPPMLPFFVAEMSSLNDAPESSLT